MDKGFQKIVLKLDATLRTAGPHIFYEPPVDHILSGFYIDKGRSLLYFGFTFLPLCGNKLTFLPLGYGDRLPGDSWGVEIGGSDQDIACRFLESIAPYRDMARDLKNLNNGIAYLERNSLIGSVHARKSLACLLIVAEKFAEAEYHLETMLDSNMKAEAPMPNWLKDVISDAKNLIRSLKDDAIETRSNILEQEMENKIKFDIL